MSALANQCPRFPKRLRESRAAKQEKQLPKSPLKISIFRSSCGNANKLILSAFPKRTGLNIALLYRRSREFPAVCNSKERNFNNVCLYGVHVPQGNPNPQKRGRLTTLRVSNAAEKREPQLHNKRGTENLRPQPERNAWRCRRLCPGVS